MIISGVVCVVTKLLPFEHQGRTVSQLNYGSEQGDTVSQLDAKNGGVCVCSGGGGDRCPNPMLKTGRRCPNLMLKTGGDRCPNPMLKTGGDRCPNPMLKPPHSVAVGLFSDWRPSRGVA